MPLEPLGRVRWPWLLREGAEGCGRDRDKGWDSGGTGAGSGMQHGQRQLRAGNRSRDGTGVGMGQWQGQQLTKACDSDTDDTRTRTRARRTQTRHRHSLAPPLREEAWLSLHPAPCGDVSISSSRLARHAPVTSQRDAIPPAGPRQDGVARLRRRRSGPVGTAGGDRGTARQRDSGAGGRRYRARLGGRRY